MSHSRSFLWTSVGSLVFLSLSACSDSLQPVQQLLPVPGSYCMSVPYALEEAEENVGLRVSEVDDSRFAVDVITNGDGLSLRVNWSNPRVAEYAFGYSESGEGTIEEPDCAPALWVSLVGEMDLGGEVTGDMEGYIIVRPDVASLSLSKQVEIENHGCPCTQTLQTTFHRVDAQWAVASGSLQVECAADPETQCQSVTDDSIFTYGPVVTW